MSRFKKYILTIMLIIISVPLLTGCGIIKSLTTLDGIFAEFFNGSWKASNDEPKIINISPYTIYINELSPVYDGDDYISYYKQTITIDLLENYSAKINPGDILDLNVGIGYNSSELVYKDIYVRYKLIVTFENTHTGEVTSLDDYNDSLLIYETGSVSQNWFRVDFNENNYVTFKTDYWFVCGWQDGNGNKYAEELYGAGIYQVLNGKIELNKTEFTNISEDYKIHLNCVVEAISSRDVPDPLQEKNGPWWE